MRPCELLGVRRFFAAVSLALASIALVAAGESSLITKPIVIVYPFTANGSSIDREASAQLATLLATQMATTGRVTVVPPPPATQRQDYLSVARDKHADYYIAGFMSALGNGVSVVEQVVSTSSGIVIYSNTVQLTTYADAAGQGEDLAALISRHANRSLASIGTPPPVAPPTAVPSEQAQTNLGKLFGRRKKPAATASASPSPAPTPATALLTASPHPSTEPVVSVPVAAATVRPPALALLPIGGSVDAALREAAGARIAAQTHAERVATEAAACAPRTREAVLSGSLTEQPGTVDGSISAGFELVAKDCAGKVLWSRGFRSDDGTQSEQNAMERVVDAAVGAYLASRK